MGCPWKGVCFKSASACVVKWCTASIRKSQPFTALRHISVLSTQSSSLRCSRLRMPCGPSSTSFTKLSSANHIICTSHTVIND